MMALESPCMTSAILLILCGNMEGTYIYCIIITILRHNLTILQLVFAGLVTISPPTVASVCRGHQLDLMCTVTGSFLQWSFSLIPENGTTAIRRTFVLTSLSSTNQLSHLQVNSTKFTFSRISAQNSVPLVSKLAINATSDGLNGTVVTCLDVQASESMATIIQIMNPIQGCQSYAII